MYGIRQHGGTMPHDACKELEQKQQEVHYAPHNRYAVNAFFPRNLFLIHRLYFHDVFLSCCKYST